MSTVVIDPATEPRVRIVADARPPGLTWAAAPPARLGRDQPALLFEPDSRLAVGPPRPGRHGVRVVTVPSAEAPPAGLPDPASWSASLALAVAEALQGQRPVGQLSRWVDERVLATVTVAVRQRRPRLPSRGERVTPARLHSVHAQQPLPSVVEASAHVQLGGRASAFAFRLDAWYDRWLCTALELGPRGSEL